MVNFTPASVPPGSPEKRKKPPYAVTDTFSEAIDALKRVEAALRASEAKYRTLFEEAPVMHVNVNSSDGTILDCNKMVAQRLGLNTCKEIIGSHFLDLYHPLCHKEAKNAFKEFQKTGRVKNKELYLVHKDGSKIPVILNVSAVRDDAGNILLSSSTWVEISELKKTQEQLATQNAAFEQMLENTMAGYWDWNFLEEKLYLSPTFKRMFGYEPSEMADSSEAWESIVHPDDLPMAIEAYEKHIKSNGKIPFDFEIRYLHKDGRVVWVMSRGKLIESDEVGNPVRMVGSLVDITPLKQAYFELQKSEERRRHMVEVVKDYAIIFLNLDGTIENWNLGAERIKGYTAAEAIGNHISIFYTKKDKEAGKPARLIEAAVANGHASDEGWRVRKNGERFWGSTTITAVHDPTGIITGFTKVTRDLTLQKQAEETQQKYIKELEVNNQLKQFAYVASHDMQEPLRTISSYLQLLARRYKDKLDEDANEFIDFAVDGANRMKALIDELLSYSKIDNEAVDCRPVDLEFVLGQVIRSLSFRIEESQAEITHDPLPTVRGSASQLAQLFQNLLSNGIKFHRSDQVPNVHVGVSQQGNMWLFSFKDNGIGIDPQFAERIFEIFLRLHNREEFGGTGIGLAICKKIVDRHGGEIWVESAEGEGATFFFTLPKHG